MSRTTTRVRTGSDRTSLYQEITDKIIAELEAGRVPWVQPWGTTSAKAPLAMPRNAATGRHYSGINVLILWGAVIQHGFPSQSWLTFRQALDVPGEDVGLQVHAVADGAEPECRDLERLGDERDLEPVVVDVGGAHGAHGERGAVDTPLAEQLGRRDADGTGAPALNVFRC